MTAHSQRDQSLAPTSCGPRDGEDAFAGRADRAFRQMQEPRTGLAGLPHQAAHLRTGGAKRRDVAGILKEARLADREAQRPRLRLRLGARPRTRLLLRGMAADMPEGGGVGFAGLCRASAHAALQIAIACHGLGLSTSRTQSPRQTRPKRFGPEIATRDGKSLCLRPGSCRGRSLEVMRRPREAMMRTGPQFVNRRLDDDAWRSLAGRDPFYAGPRRSLQTKAPADLSARAFHFSAAPAPLAAGRCRYQKKLDRKDGPDERFSPPT